MWKKFEEEPPNDDTLVLCLDALGGMFLAKTGEYITITGGRWSHISNLDHKPEIVWWHPLPDLPQLLSMEAKQ